MAGMSQALADIARRMENMAAIGTIAEVDHAGGRLRLSIAGRLTGWLRHPAMIGRNFRAWFPARAGTQVQASCPSGDPGNGAIAATLYTDDLAPPASSPELDIIAFNDGTTVQYDSAKKELSLYSAGDIRIKAEGTVWIDAANIRVFEAG